MVTCTKCRSKWSARDIWKLGWSKEGKRCSNCGERQYISRETQGMLTLGYLSVALLVVIPFVMKLSDTPSEL